MAAARCVRTKTAYRRGGAARRGVSSCRYRHGHANFNRARVHAPFLPGHVVRRVSYQALYNCHRHSRREIIADLQKRSEEFFQRAFLP